MVFKTFSKCLLISLYTIFMYCAGANPDNMVQLEKVCYKWYANSLSSNDATDACRKTRGIIAGEAKSFAGIMNRRPELKNFLPKDNCYWVGGRNGRPEHKGFADLLGFRGNWYFRERICHNGTLWKESFKAMSEKRFYICEYDLPSCPEIPPTVSIIKTRTVKRQSDSTVIVGRPLFNNVAPLPTMCSRLCQRFTGCSAFNYNTETKECRGFEDRVQTCSSHNRDWELWIIE